MKAKTQNQNPEPPKHLSAASKVWFEAITTDYVLEPVHIRLLAGAAESWDEYDEERRRAKREGRVFKDRFGQWRPHPSVAIAHAALLRFEKLTRALGLDIEAPDELNRLPTQKGRAGLRAV